MAAPTDEMLLRRLQAGDVEGFTLLVHRYSEELHQFVFRFTKSAATADDVIQETFLQVFHSAGSYDPARRVKPWLFTIAANKARDALRRRQRHREVSLDADIDGSDEEGQSFADLMTREEADPDQPEELEAKRRAVRAAVERLPPRLAEVLILAYFHRFPYKEIAEIVGVPLGTIKSRLHAAVGQFQRYFAEGGGQSAIRGPSDSVGKSGGE